MAQEPFALGTIIAGGVTSVAVLLFIGATGKSAQIPLLTWLPDAMAGPTPVSALIHAATMVTAGVYMVVRCNAIYQNAPTAMFIVAIIGCLHGLRLRGGPEAVGRAATTAVVESIIAVIVFDAIFTILVYYVF